MGVNLDLTPEQVAACIAQVGMGFMFAPRFHPAMKYAIGPRKEIGIRTVFNILGPLTNPARASTQLLGVFSAEMTETLATVLCNLGSRKAYVVHGTDKLDEISICAETRIAELSNGAVRSYTVSPEDLGFQRATHADIEGGNPPHNAEIIRGILDGKKGPPRDIVTLNAAFALAAAGVVATPQEGIHRACEAIDYGAAKEKLRLLVEKTKGR